MSSNENVQVLECLVMDFRSIVENNFDDLDETTPVVLCFINYLKAKLYGTHFHYIADEIINCIFEREQEGCLYMVDSCISRIEVLGIDYFELIG